MISHDSLHPSISKFKNQAKKLKKQSNISLMQAQTVVAKNNGYNNWHDFLQKLKSIFVPENKYDGLNQPIHTTSKDIHHVPQDGFFHLGKENNYLEHWLSWSQARSHLHIVEEFSSIYSMDVYVAKQAVLHNQPIIFSSSDTEATKVLINFALSHNRKKIFLFDTADQIENFQQYKNYKISLSGHTAGSLSYFLNSYNNDEGLGKLYQDEFMHYLQLVSYITFYQKQVEKKPISIDLIANNGNLKQFEKYSEIFPIDHQMKEHIKKATISFSNNLEKFKAFEKDFLCIIKKIKATNLFNDKAIEDKKGIEEKSFASLYDKDKDYPIFIFLSNQSQLPEQLISDKIKTYSELVNITVMGCYRHLLGDILGTPIENRNDRTYTKREKTDSIAFIMRNPPRYQFGSIAAQNRAIGSSFIFTFNNLQHYHSPEFDNLLSNANNYFFGKFTGQINSNFQIKNLFNKKLSEYLLHQAYGSKKIVCEYNSEAIEHLLQNEYILFNKTKLVKLTLSSNI